MTAQWDEVHHWTAQESREFGLAFLAWARGKVQDMVYETGNASDPGPVTSSTESPEEAELDASLNELKN